jgi:hypothetical protein
MIERLSMLPIPSPSPTMTGKAIVSTPVYIPAVPKVNSHLVATIAFENLNRNNYNKKLGKVALFALAFRGGPPPSLQP